MMRKISQQLQSQNPIGFGTLPSLNPPSFFEIVEHEVYASNKFDSSSFQFISNLGLRTIVYLSFEDLSRELVDFFKDKEIQVIHLGMKYRKFSHWTGISEGLAKEAIEYILDQSRHPIMVMCKTGVYFAGTIIGCLRRLQNWSLTATIDKYRNLASSVKTRFENEQFIELFDVDLVTLPDQLPEWFLINQRLMEEERIAISKNEIYPRIDINITNTKTNSDVEEQVMKKTTIEKEKKETELNSDEAPSVVATQMDDKVSPPTEKSIPAYQKHYFHLQGPLTSPSVVFSEKKSIVGDDEDD